MPNRSAVRRLVMRRRMVAAAPAFSALINFRDTAGYVTDGAGQTYCLSADTYPTNRGGLTFGWETGPGGSADRDSGVDPRLAGVGYTFGGAGTAVFRLDLPAAGTFNMRVAMGDASFTSAPTIIDFKDTSSTIYTLTDAVGPLGGHWVDANGTDFNGSAAWVSGNTVKSLTFSTTIFRFDMRKTGGGGATTIAHVSVTS